MDKILGMEDFSTFGKDGKEKKWPIGVVKINTSVTPAQRKVILQRAFEKADAQTRQPRPGMPGMPPPVPMGGMPGGMPGMPPGMQPPGGPPPGAEPQPQPQPQGSGDAQQINDIMDMVANAKA